ncbi:unnamed protein product [Thlaspi arvense]|uniref:Uncharacterized protein n=1 Tax=Thlaspi arvense TaxID=13288 RepID=A0AAU9SWZ5_THLAR|nr:unnamed protein product [Thlaspi arvense]
MVITMRSLPIKRCSYWSERRRLEIAGLMSSVLRAHLNAYDPVLSMTLRYLISIHKEFCFRQGISSPISDLDERLLLEERDPAATLRESLYEAPPFDEVDIQALAHAVELTRQGAIDSLKFARGDLFQAFQTDGSKAEADEESRNELCRMRLDLSMVDELVREYCVYRGIVDSGLTPPAAGTQAALGSGAVSRAQPGHCSPGSCSLDVLSSTSKHSDGETSISNAHTDGSPDMNIDVILKNGTLVRPEIVTKTVALVELTFLKVQGCYNEVEAMDLEKGANASAGGVDKRNMMSFMKSPVEIVSKNLAIPLHW